MVKDLRKYWVIKLLLYPFSLLYGLITDLRNILYNHRIFNIKQYDIVFMDLLMPEMDGIETTSAIRKLGHEMPIIALTAIENDITRKSALAAGINDYLVKPASAEDVRNILLRTFSKTL